MPTSGRYFIADVRVEHRGFTLEGADDLAVGNRFVRDGWDRTFHVSTNAQIDLDGDPHPCPAPRDPPAQRRGGRASRTSSPTSSTPTPSGATDGWRFQTMALSPVWSTGQSHFDITTSEQ